ncbi:sodium:solute symporter family protein [Mangrovibacterium lignilyticum]|uniref:sodium:solute symporter family protein n=1 Tax=Mangrovibacterium lignilyticum TaxID=2668052 RepID=UPI0013D5EF49|nr:sodium:solute symporter family protein [Mangrovibacterium lignilyticum]
MKITILIIYGLILLIIGVLSALKIKSPTDYFVAGRKNGMLQISGSLLASILGGSAILGSINLTIHQSWAAAWYLLAASAGLWLLLPLVSRVNKLGKFTLTDMIGRFYGQTARKSAAIIIPMAWTGIVAAQIIAAAKILFSLFALPYADGVIISSAVFIGYTLIGGQISILKTDFLQAIIILVGIACSALFLSFTHGPHTSSIGESFPFNSHFGATDLLILFLTFSSTFVVGPDIYSRVFCAKDERTARQSIILVAGILIPFAFVMTYLGVFAVENLSAEQLTHSVVLVDLIAQYLPEWVLGLMAAALLSAVLSSADTTLLTASMMLSELFNEDIDNRKSLNTTRIFIVVIGIASMLIALQITSIIGTLLLALAFYSGAFIIPIIAALTNLQVNKRLSIVAMLAGGLVALCGKILVSSYGHSWANWLILSAFVINFLILMVPEKKHN